MRGVRGDAATPGEFRPSQNWIGPPGCTLNDASYVPPPPDELMPCLDALERLLHVVRVSFGSLRASSAILRCRVEMTSRPNVPVIFPSASSIIRPAASLRRVLWGEFPDLAGTISRLRLLAPRRASLRFLRSALPPLRLPSLPRGQAVPRKPGPLLPRRPRRPSTVEKTRPPRFLGDPCVHAALLDPGGPPNPGHFRTGDVVFHLRNDVDSASTAFGAPSRGLHALCVRFAAGVTPGPRNTRFRLVASLDRSGLSPAGSLRRFRSCRSVYMASPFTKLCLAQYVIRIFFAVGLRPATGRTRITELSSITPSARPLLRPFSFGSGHGGRRWLSTRRWSGPRPGSVACPPARRAPRLRNGLRSVGTCVHAPPATAPPILRPVRAIRARPGKAAAQLGESDEHQAQAVCGVHLVAARRQGIRRARDRL